MKIYAVLSLLAAAAATVAAAVLMPVLGSQKIVAKRASHEFQRQENAKNKQLDAALASFRGNDVKQRTRAREILMRMREGDFRRPSFAAALAQQGEVQVAFEVEKVRARFLELSLPDDREMAFYAGLAERSGHPKEAAWARNRIGPKGHYRIWLLGPMLMFKKRGSGFPGGRAMYETIVNHQMDDGIRLHPAFRKETETLRRELLSAP